MTKVVLSLLVSLWLVGAAQAQTQAVWQSGGSAAAVGEVIPVAGGPLDGVDEILRMEPEHLLTLAAGIVVGATVITPYLGVGELVGIGLGVIASEVFFRSFVKRRSLF